MPIKGWTKGIPVRMAGGSFASWVALSRKRRKMHVATRPPRTRPTIGVIISDL
jgi:hypothetical protein